MSRIFLLRHAQSEANAKGILAGRLENISLSKTGLKEREQLNDRFVDTKFDRIISSPIQRCLETIQEFSKSPEIVQEFSEVDYGDWTGRKMSSLIRNKAWREIHKNPASVRFPNGETLPEVQTRVLLGLDSILRSSGNKSNKSKKSKNILISTHADVVKVLVLHALGTHLNNIDKVSIDNASISIIDNTDNGLRVIRVNDNTSKIAQLLK